EFARYLPGALRCAHFSTRLCLRPRTRRVYSGAVGLVCGRFLTAVRPESADRCFSGPLRVGIARELPAGEYLLLVVAAVAGMLGTLYPLVIDFAGLGKISVGAAWFNTMFVPLSLVLALVIAYGAMARWKADELKRLGMATAAAMVAAVVLGIATPFIVDGELNWQVMLGMGVSFWLIGATLLDVWQKARGQLRRVPKLGLSYQGMVLAHLGVAISIIGVTMVSNYSIEKAVRMAPGDSAELGNYRFEMTETGHIEGPNYVSD